MTSRQNWTLLTPPSVDEANQRTVLFLNSRFQDFDNLGELESLACDAQQRRELLQSKLSSSQLKINALLADARVSLDAHLHTAQELSLLRHSLTDELSDLTQQLISTMSDGEGKPTLLEDIETLHRSLKELQSVKGYVQVIEHALKLSESSIQSIRNLRSTISTASLGYYRSLSDFVSKVLEACSGIGADSEEPTLNLVQFLEKIRERTWAELQGILASSLVEAAGKIGWPMPVDYSSASAGDRSKFELAFRNLSNLQKLGEKIRAPDLLYRSWKGSTYSMQALVQPISLRFKYHFDGKRQTNRLDKPEWYFTHILDVIHDHRPFMDSIVQKLISSDYTEVNAWHEFTTLLLSILSRKVKQTIPSLLPHPSLLAHTIYQALLFDAALAEEGYRAPQAPTTESVQAARWKGVSEVILGNVEWFNTWLLEEQKFAEDQYHDIIAAADAWLVEGYHENSNSGNSDLKSTHSARRVCSLVEQVTDRYSPLPHLDQRSRFLLEVQLPLLDHYHGRITSSLDAFETLSSAFVRAVPGALSVSLGGRETYASHADSKGLTNGVEGVQRLCKALLSAMYIQVSLRRWGEELFFVELWTEMNQSSALPSHTIFSSLLPDAKVNEEEVPSGTLFDTLIRRYEHLANRTEDMIVQQVCGEVENVLKAHFSVATSLDRDLEQVDDIAPSQSLLMPVTLMTSHLSFLQTVLPRTVLTILYRRITSRLAEHILQRQILYRGRFTLREGKRFRDEYELWVESCHSALGGALGGGRARVEAPWTKLLQAGSLASSEGDVWLDIVNITFGTRSNDEWDQALARMLGSIEIRREDVAKILRRREDCDL